MGETAARFLPWPGGEGQGGTIRKVPPCAPLVTFPALGKLRPPAGAAPAGAEAPAIRKDRNASPASGPAASDIPRPPFSFSQEYGIITKTKEGGKPHGG